jgi:hypothetical protein
VARAEEAPHQLLLGEGEAEGGDGEHIVDGRHAHHHRPATGAGGGEARCDQARPTHRLEGGVHADPPGQLQARRGHVDGGGIDDVGEAEGHRQLAPGGHRVGADHPGGAGDPGALDDRHPDPPETDDEDRRPRLQPGGVEHRAHPRLHGAAEHGGHLEGRVVGDLDRPVGGQHRRLGERRQERPRPVHGPAPMGEPGVAVGQRPRETGVGGADAQLAAHAPVAASARRAQGQDDPLTLGQVEHLRTHGLDDAGGLVAEDGGKGGGQRAVDVVQVGVAHPAVVHPDPHLALTGLGELDVVDHLESVDRPQEGGAHGLAR